MRVLMTTDTVGGVWTFSRELVSGLLAAGCAVALVSLGRLPDESQLRWTEGMRQRWGASFLYRATDVPLEWMEENGRAYSAAASLLSELAVAFKADVLHSNQLCFGSLPASIPVLVTAHSDVLSWAQACRGRAPEEGAWLEQYRRLVSDGLRAADAVVAPSQWMLRALRENFELPRERAVIANGRTILRPGGARKKVQAVSVGRLWDEAKGSGMLGQVQSPMPLVLAGEATYGGQARSFYGKGIRLAGLLSEEEVLKLFSESAVYVCTSKYEPFGLAPLEAALCGCAVVANDVASLREVWGDGATYFTDAAMLSRILTSLHADTGLLGRAQALSFERARTYTRDAMTAAYLSLFAAMLGRGGELTHVA